MYNNPYKRVVGAPRPQSNPWNVTGKIERPSNAQMLKTIEAYHADHSLEYYNIEVKRYRKETKWEA